MIGFAEMDDDGLEFVVYNFVEQLENFVKPALELDFLENEVVVSIDVVFEHEIVDEIALQGLLVVFIGVVEGVHLMVLGFNFKMELPKAILF